MSEGRRPDGPGWYWYTGPYVDDGDEIVDDDQPVPVEVIMSPWKHRENEVLFTGSSVAQKLSHLPGDFVPLHPPVAAPQPDWSQAPEWAMWWAVDSWGIRLWFQREPRTDMGKWREPLHGESLLEYDGPGEELPLGVDWRTTLRKRPEVGP